MLSTLQTIIQAHGGCIWIESNLDGGAFSDLRCQR
jgi:hypothetical protein